MAITGTFYWDRLHWGILYILCLDYLGVAFWYWWLVGQVLDGSSQATNDRAVCLCHGSAFARYCGCWDRLEAVGYCTGGEFA